MAKLRELVANAQVEGLEPQGPVTIITARPYGDYAVELVWKNAAGDASPSVVLYEAQAEPLRIVKTALPWTFQANAADLLLASEAWRIHYAHLFDPYLAVRNSDVEPLPHQISAVYQHMLRRFPLRYLLADDPGAGKTVMTGLLLKELLARGALARCLIVCPGSLALQWQEELDRKFSLSFEIITRDRINNAVSGNIFEETAFAIARLDQLARFDELQQKLKATEWDLIVCDEAHKMSAPVFGGEAHPTRRYNLGKTLSRIARNFLLLTATPHNGKDEDFQQFLALIDEDRFGRFSKSGGRGLDVSDVMRRLVKEELLKFDGAKLFPERVPHTLNYTLSPLEKELYEAVTAYVQSEFNRADRLDKKRRVNVGFALTVLQRRLASSPEAIYQSLERRRRRLQEQLAGINRFILPDLTSEEEFEEEDLSIEELERLENQFADQASAASTIAELETEIATLKSLLELALRVRSSGTDRKWEELSRLLQTSQKMFDEAGAREKLIIFTEHRDTLNYLAAKIRALLGKPEAVVTIQGGMSREERHAVEESFRQDKTAQVLVATDAAGEGVNLQRAHLMVNYDLPWNPNRLEQRFGRIHRIGQTRTCWLWNLVAGETREGAVFERLFQKLERQRAALGGKVFDVLGKISFGSRPLYKLLIDAIRQERQEDAKAASAKIIDSAFDATDFQRLLREDALSSEVMDVSLINEMAEEMERIEARRLQPYYIQDFFCKAFAQAGGKLTPRKSGLYEITHVPAILRNRPHSGKKAPVLRRYESVCFDKAHRQGRGDVALICPGHPLLDALLEHALERHGNLLKQGAILIDRNDFGTEPALLLYLETAIVDGTLAANGRHTKISRQIQFVRMTANGFTASAGYAPYLDYSPPTQEELQVLLPYAQNLAWLDGKVEEEAVCHAIQHTVPPLLSEVANYRKNLLDKTERAIRQRMQAEIDNQYSQAAKFRQKRQNGATNLQLIIQNAENRANELRARRDRRLAQIALQRQLSARTPIVAGGSLIIPQGLVYKLLPESAPPDFAADAASRKEIELAAMKAVMRLENELGFQPRDVSGEKCGYDILSAIPQARRKPGGICQRFIEVKGRRKGAREVAITKNEIICALNSRENFILALAEVDDNSCHVTYLKNPFGSYPDDSLTRQFHDIASLFRAGELILTRDYNLHELSEKAD